MLLLHARKKSDIFFFLSAKCKDKWLSKIKTEDDSPIMREKYLWKKATITLQRNLNPMLKKKVSSKIKPTILMFSYFFFLLLSLPFPSSPFPPSPVLSRNSSSFDKLLFKDLSPKSKHILKKKEKR